MLWGKLVLGDSHMWGKSNSHSFALFRYVTLRSQNESSMKCKDSTRRYKNLTSPQKSGNVSASYVQFSEGNLV